MKMNNKVINILVAVALAVAGCNSNKNDYKEMRDSDLLVQLMSIKPTQDEQGMAIYKVRIVPGKKLVDSKGVSRQDMWYHMDSCFYLTKDKHPVYASLVQPVANGVSGSFEYLLEFEANIDDKNEWGFVYDGRYLNHKHYTLQLNNTR